VIKLDRELFPLNLRGYLEFCILIFLIPVSANQYEIKCCTTIK